MKRLSIIIGITTFLMGAVGLHAQTDPYGQLDSVIVADAQVSLTHGFAVSVSLVNDEEVRAFSIPLNYSKSIVVFDSASFIGCRADDWSYHQVMHDGEAGTVLLGGLSINDPLLPAGSGSLANIYFHAASGAKAGDIGLIDSVFVPPAGEFVITAFDNFSISPAFKAGNLIVTDSDLPPVFVPLSRRIVNEGDTISFDVRAVDPERAKVSLAAEKLPVGGSFADHGDGHGTFSYVVPYTGPGSAAESPYELIFVATDGGGSSFLEVPLEVVNINRLPQFMSDLTFAAGAGDTVYLPVVVTDPDFERVTIESPGLPGGAEISPTSPGYLTWESGIADSGSHAFTVIARDESGGVQTDQLQLELSPTLPIDLSISEEQAFSNSRLEVTLSMLNRVEVTGFDLLISFDPSVLTLTDVVKEGTRIEHWHEFERVIQLGDGRVWINAACDSTGGSEGALELGLGTVAILHFATASDLAFAGYYSRLEFEFLDPESESENIVFDIDGATITPAQIDYETGGVLIKAYDALVGDLNLNGVAFEVADLVYYSNYFINPFQYPLDGERWANSDINQDGQGGTLADLIYMQDIINDDGPKLATTEFAAEAQYDLRASAAQVSYNCAGVVDAAGAFFKFALPAGAAVDFLPTAVLGNMEIKSGRDNDTLRVLISSSYGNTFSASGVEIFRLIGSDGVELVSQSWVDAAGREVTMSRSRRSLIIPEIFDLSQNYPNPFNPQTTIAFSLPQSAQVKLKIYNVLGELVRELVNDYLPAGRHEVAFDGTNVSGHEVASGVYFYRLQAGSYQNTRKMLLLK